MTRQNLQSHLSWLLKTQDSWRPTVIPFPPARDTPIGSQSFENSENTFVSTDSAVTSSAGDSRTQNTRGDPGELSTKDMGWLVSTPASKKPAIVLDKNKLYPDLSFRSDSKPTQDDPFVSTQSRTPLRVGGRSGNALPDADIKSFNPSQRDDRIGDREIVDLTAHSQSPSQRAADRPHTPQPRSNRGKKRKSTEISGSPTKKVDPGQVDDSEDDFFDIESFLGSDSTVPDTSRFAKLCTAPLARNSPSLPEDSRGRPTAPRDGAPGPSTEGKGVTGRRHKHGIASGSVGTIQARSSTALSDDDDDDLFVSAKRLKKPPPEGPLPSALRQESVRDYTSRLFVGSSSPNLRFSASDATTAYNVSCKPLSGPDCDDGLDKDVPLRDSAMIGFLFANPSAIQEKHDDIGTQLRDIRVQFEQALKGGKKEYRDRIKEERLKLHEKQASLKQALEIFASLMSLVSEKDILARKISDDFDKLLDTEKDEAELDGLHTRIRMVEQSLCTSLLASGIVGASSFAATIDPPRPGIGRDSGSYGILGNKFSRQPIDAGVPPNGRTGWGSQGQKAGRGDFPIDHQLRSKSTTVDLLRGEDIDMLDAFADLSDEEEMVAMAQHAESLHLAQKAESNPRNAFLETSGNISRHATPKTSHTRPGASSEATKYPWSDEVSKVLKDRFRMKGFRCNQLEAINATLGGHDAFVLMPTGGGKSLCYQLPAVVKSGKTRGITVVISPLISLMQDQVDHLKNLGIQAVAFNGEATSTYRSQIMSVFDEQNPDHFIELLYVTPEMVNKSQAFMAGLSKLFRKKKLARIVIDEAHCVSQWGHDFRPDYKEIGHIRENFPGIPLMALTATATRNVIIDTRHNLGMDNCRIFSQSFNRPNLYYEVRRKTGGEASTVTDIVKLIKEKYDGQSGIIYTISRRSAENVASKLSHSGISCRHYHAEVPPEEKTATQQAWQQGKVKVVVATIAFGMGIDKPDVRFVIHVGLAKSLEGYYQETGRAGRDDKPSDCILFFGFQDVWIHRRLVSQGKGSPVQIERQMALLSRAVSYFDSESDCRRVEILRYFGEVFTKAQCKMSCDNCQRGGTFVQRDITDLALAAVRIVKASEKMTISQCCDFLLGLKRHNVQPAAGGDYGIARGQKKYQLQGFIDKLAAQGIFSERDVYIRGANIYVRYLYVEKAADDLVAGRRKFLVTVKSDAQNEAPKTKLRKGSKASKKDAGETSRAPPSTIVSSPANIKRRRRTKPAVLNDDEADDGGAFGGGSDGMASRHTSHGYVRDNFVVSDGDDLFGGNSDGDDWDGEPEPFSRRKPAVRANSVGPPLLRRDINALPEIHQEIIQNFVLEARRTEEKMRNAQGIRKPLFPENVFREMAINWTTTLDQMRRIPGIDLSRVDSHGAAFVPLVTRFRKAYHEITQQGQPTEAEGSGSLEGMVGLVSSDEEADFVEGRGGEMKLESSKYFRGDPAQPSPRVQEWHAQLEKAGHQSTGKTKRAYAPRASSKKRFSGPRKSGGSGKKDGAGSASTSRPAYIPWKTGKTSRKAFSGIRAMSP